MSRRHKNEIEITENQKSESQGDNTQHTSIMRLNFSVIHECSHILTDGHASSYLAEKITSALAHAFWGIDAKESKVSSFFKIIEERLSEQSELTALIQNSVIEKYRELERADAENYTRGKRKVERLLGGYENHEVTSWFDKIRSHFKKVIGSIKQMLCCFFCALFDIVYTEEPYQKVACYHRIMMEHIKEKIPCLKTIQDGIKWFRSWKVSVLRWKDKAKEGKKHEVWEHLYAMIKGYLPQLEPSLAY